MLDLPISRRRSLALLLLALFWIAAGINHFWHPDFYLRIMPPWLPAHAELVWWSGVAEVVGGIAVLIPRIRQQAGWGLIALLVAVYPANIEMALHPERFPGISPLALYGRLPFQLLFVAWAWWATRTERRT
jgi:uncharacterized membrane protein